MSRCFVIQPFDKGRYDKRYDDVFEPAIRDAELEPYRVDRDPKVTIPIADIETGIAACDACLAEISTDNPNVWFELGYAIASNRVVVLVCSEERTNPFPFDVQHRSVIKYKTESKRDFEDLQSQITLRLKALLETRASLGRVAQMPSIAKFEGLQPHEIGALVAVAQRIDKPDDSVPAGSVRQDMENAGFTALAVTLGLKLLLDKDMVEAFEETDYNADAYTAYRVKDVGMSWLIANQDKLTLKKDAPASGRDMADDDLPF